MAHSQTAHRLAKPQAKTGSRVTTTEFPSVPERRTGPEPHAPRGRIHALQGPFEPIGVRGESKAPADRATPSVHQPSSHPPALQRKPLTTRQASLQERPANGEKASAPGAPGTRTPNLTVPTGPTPPVRQPYSRPPALQRKPLTTRLAFPLERQADDRKTSGSQEDRYARSAATPPTPRHSR